MLDWPDDWTSLYTEPRSSSHSHPQKEPIYEVGCFISSVGRNNFLCNCSLHKSTWCPESLCRNWVRHNWINHRYSLITDSLNPIFQTAARLLAADKKLGLTYWATRFRNTLKHCWLNCGVYTIAIPIVRYSNSDNHRSYFDNCAIVRIVVT